MLTELYPDVLVESSASSVPEPEKHKFLGQNKKNILLFVSHASVPFLPDQELQFLTNILSACSLGLADVAIVNRQNLDETLSLQLIDDTEAKNVIMFGTDPLSIGLPMNFPHFQLQQFNKRTYLYAPPLSEVEADKSLKGKLWGCLKTLFGI